MEKIKRIINGIVETRHALSLQIAVAIAIIFSCLSPSAAQAQTNGTVTVTRQSTGITSGAIVRGGDALTITATPDNGYVLQTLVVNGVNVTADYPQTGGYVYTVGTSGATRMLDVSTKVLAQGADIVATFAPEVITPTYGVSIGTFEGGVVSASETANIPEGETVELTISPDNGYVLDWIEVYETDDPSNILTLSGTGNTRTFEMPAYGVTVAATFRNPDAEAVNTAKGLIEGMSSISVAQATANTEAAAKAWLAAQINALSGMSATGITVTEANITISGFTAAQAGTASIQSGTPGSFTFTVSLTKSASSATTASMSGVITTTAYDATQDNADISAAKTAIEGATYGPVLQTTLNTQAEAKAYVENIIAALNLNGVTATVVDGTFTAAVAGTSTDPNGANGSYTFTVNLNKGGGTQQTTIQLTLTITATPLVNAATPAISGQPQGATVTAGNPVTLTVSASITDGGTLSYQWYSNTTNSNTGGTAINGATGSSYSPPTATAGTRYYYVVVTNTNNSVNGTKTATTTSSVATVTVNALVNAQAPNIAGHPQGATVTTGSPVTLNVSATSPDGGTLSYQWYSNTANSNTGGAAISGATGSAYSPSTATAGTSYYYVVVTNTNNSVNGQKTATTTSSVATVTVNAIVNAQTPSITGHPQGATVTAGNPVTLTVSANVTDGGTLSYQWYSNTANANSGGTAVGTNSNSYSPPTAAAGTRYYYVVITNTNNSVNGTKTATATSNTAAVTVNAPVSTYSVTVAPTTNGSVSANPTTAAAGATVTLTISPASSYELDAVSTTPTVTLSGSGNTRTFTMPASDITVHATFKKTQEQLDREAVEAAKAAIEGGTYRVAQGTANDAASVKTWLAGTLNVLFGQSHGVQFRSTASIVGDVEITAITPAVAGTVTIPNGTDGSFAFTVTLTRGATTLTAAVPTGVIVATPYDALTGIDSPQSKSLKAYIQNGMLHVSGLTAGKPWAVYSISGALMYQNTANGDEADVSLSVRGVYIVKSGIQAVKVVY